MSKSRLFTSNIPVTASVAKEWLAKYVWFSAFGAAAGGAVGSIASVFPIGDDLTDKSISPEFKVKPRGERMTAIVEDSSKIIGRSIGVGMWFGGLPITYPVTKAYNYLHDQHEVKNGRFTK